MRRNSLRVVTLGLLVVAGGGELGGPVQGAVILSGQPNVAGGPSTLEITTPITFTVTQTGNVNFLIFDEWVASSDGSTTAVSDVPAQSLTYEVNGFGGSTAINSLLDNFATTQNDATARDGFLLLSPSFPVVVGDQVTMLVQTRTFGGNVGFNPLAIGAFTGGIFLATSTGVRLTANTSLVPEPSSYALCGGLALAAWAVRRRFTR